MGPVSREEMMRKIIQNPPKSQGLGREALVQTIECQQACDVLQFAKPSNATPVELVYPDSSRKQLKGETSRIYTINNPSVSTNSPTGTIVFIKQGSRVFGTFLKVDNRENKWIQLKNVIDVDSGSIQTLFVKGVGQFKIRGIVIPK
jgi:hypothetical protein